MASGDQPRPRGDSEVAPKRGQRRVQRRQARRGNQASGRDAARSVRRGSCSARTVARGAAQARLVQLGGHARLRRRGPRDRPQRGRRHCVLAAARSVQSAAGGEARDGGAEPAAALPSARRIRAAHRQGKLRDPDRGGLVADAALPLAEPEQRGGGRARAAARRGGHDDQVDLADARARRRHRHPHARGRRRHHARRHRSAARPHPHPAQQEARSGARRAGHLVGGAAHALERHAGGGARQPAQRKRRSC
mmetsp:Transcript_12216/g.26109  ORF Transcript_12216/g.26109 Transcript_12216/m.26109 type:complete len:250 (+) Transcript_12216:346-1095(+)